MELKTGRPGALADLASVNTAAIRMPFRAAWRLSSLTCESIERICLSSASLDLRQYAKYELMLFDLSTNGFTLPPLKNAANLGTLTAPTIQGALIAALRGELWSPKNIRKPFTSGCPHQVTMESL
jgi:hypothetical protein